MSERLTIYEFDAEQAAALRFDGYAWCESHGINWGDLLNPRMEPHRNRTA